MRLFCAMLALGSGCAFGDDNTVDPFEPDLDLPDMDNMGELGEPQPSNLVAGVCDQKTWDLFPDTKHLDVAVVATGAGATVFGVPKDGGAVRGFRVDQRGDAFDRDMIEIRGDRNYTSVSASVAAGRLVVSSVVGDKVALDIVRDDLGAIHQLGDVSGELITPVTTSRDQQVAVVGGPFGVVANGFTGALWESAGQTELSKSAINSLTATKYFEDVVFAYSTDIKECHLTQFASRKSAMMKNGCDNARIAMNEAHERGFVVFEEAGDVFRAQLLMHTDAVFQPKQRVAETASSPRVVFDGTYHWVSYINLHGDLVVGFIDAQGNLRSRALEGTRPSHPDAYDLAVFGNGVWVVDVDTDGFGAQRMCVVEQ
jgi:hypothetical protein